MAQLIALALVGGVAWYAWRAFQREMTRVGNELRDTGKVDDDAPTRLERGEDGVWRPKQDD